MLTWALAAFVLGLMTLESGKGFMMGLGMMLLLSCSVFPLVSIASHERLAIEGADCGDGHRSAVLDVGGTSPYVRVVEDDSLARTWLPAVRYSDFKRDESFANNDISEVLRSLRPGSLLIHGYDVRRDLPRARTDAQGGDAAWPRLRWAVVPPEIQEVDEGLYFFCGVDMHITQGAADSRDGWTVTFVTRARRLQDVRE